MLIVMEIILKNKSHKQDMNRPKLNHIQKYPK